jgi:hypothetical protein
MLPFAVRSRIEDQTLPSLREKAMPPAINGSLAKQSILQTLSADGLGFS